MKRSCGKCHACCDHVAVHSLNKPPQTLCPLLQVYDGKGCCSSYECRPPECATYTCSWMDGHLPADWRPDVCGILFESGRIEWPSTIRLMTGFELVPGSIESQRRLLQQISRPGTVAIVVPHQLVGEIHEGSMPVRIGAGAAAGSARRVTQRTGPAGGDPDSSLRTATDGGRPHGPGAAGSGIGPEGAGDRALGEEPARGIRPADVGPVQAESDGGAEPEWFGNREDIRDVKSFFTMCMATGGLTMRMADRDVSLPMR